ncbi:EF-hand domain-containing protein 1-like isoform X2 [Artemia franciscana]
MMSALNRSTSPAPPPNYVTYDRCCLRFNATFTDGGITRHVVITYYLEDDSMTIVEPPVPNSGLIQGKLLTRQRPKRNVDDYLVWEDIKFDRSVKINGRDYKITGCDDWTVDFYAKAGIDVPFNRPRSSPLNERQVSQHRPATPQRNSVSPESHSHKSNGSSSRKYKLRQYLEHDGHVLRFSCIWDRTYEGCFNSEEAREPCVLSYFLADDTIEVRKEKKESSYSPSAKSERNPFGPNQLLSEQIIIKRQRVKKASSYSNCASLMDEEDFDHYDPEDFQLGRTIELYGKRLRITDCDAFTRSFYEEHFGIRF